MICIPGGCPRFPLFTLRPDLALMLSSHFKIEVCERERGRGRKERARAKTSLFVQPTFGNVAWYNIFVGNYDFKNNLKQTRTLEMQGNRSVASTIVQTY